MTVPLAGWGASLPTGGDIVQGSGQIHLAGDTLTVHQQSQRLITDWQSFNIGAGKTVDFRQPGAEAVALNRVLGHEGSAILGRLRADGQVFLINPNGVLFGDGAQVDVGGLVASTLALSDEDFLRGDYRFRGDGGGSITNRGQLLAADGGYIALLGGQVSNQGVIRAQQGSIALAAGSRMTLDFAGDGLLNVQVDEGVAQALVDNGQLLQADGGQVLMTAGASDALLGSVVNNTGVVRARTLAHREGRILLLGDMAHGEANVSGELEAGFVETSAATVRIDPDLVVDTNGGEWLIDPVDITIDSGMASAIVTGLGSGDVTVTTAAGGDNGSWGQGSNANPGTDAGDIHVNAAIHWHGANTLTLLADNDIHINQSITAESGNLTLNAQNGITATAAVDIGGVFSLQRGDWIQNNVTLPDFNAHDFRFDTTNASFLRTTGGAGTGASPWLLTDIYGVQGMAGNALLSQHFALSGNVDAAGTEFWYSGDGFNPIGNSAHLFTGGLDGLGHSISGLIINRGNSNNAGLFGYTSGALLTRIGLENINVTGGNYVGGLVGVSYNSTISQSHVTGGVAGTNGVGGLVGNSYSNTEITQSYVTADVKGNEQVGGLAGHNHNSTINQSYATGSVEGTRSVGGLVGRLENSGSTVSQSYAASSVTGEFQVGGLIGIQQQSRVEQSYAIGSVTALDGEVDGGGDNRVRALVGFRSGGSMQNNYWDMDTTGYAGSWSGLDGTGLTTGQMQSLTSFSAWGPDIDAEGGTGSVWRIYDGHTAPLLRVFMTEFEAFLPEFDGSGGHLNNIASIDDSGWSAAVASGHLFGNLATAHSLTLTGSRNAGEYRVSSDATAGLYSHQQGYDLITSRVITDSNVSAAGDVALTHGASWHAGILRIDTSGAITTGPNGVINGGAESVFELASGHWQQSSATLPGFAVNDFRLDHANATFLRVTGGDGISSPYGITDVYGLQGMASYNLLGSDFTLVNDIDASSTANWHSGAGFDAVGKSAARFTGTFDGRGHVITGLTIDRENETNIGLFGHTGGNSVIRDVGLVNIDVTGRISVGGLAGRFDGGGISGVQVTGEINGDTAVGGLVGTLDEGTIALSHAEVDVTGREDSAEIGGLVGGQSGGEISQSHASGSVVGSFAVGGLVGHQDGGSIRQSYASGAVTAVAGPDVVGAESAGGLVGSQYDGSIEQSFATGAVTGDFAVGGLVGRQDGGSISQSYAMGDVTGAMMFIGGLVGVQGGSIHQSYATGETSGGSFIGGLVGLYEGVITDSFWNSDAREAGFDAMFSTGTVTDTVGVSMVELQQLATFGGWSDDIDNAGGTGSVWRIYDGHTTPLLRAFLAPLNVTVEDASAEYNGSVQTGAGAWQANTPFDPSLLLGSGVVSGGGRNAGEHALGLTGLYSGQQGYDLTIQEGTLTITPRPMEIIALAQDRTYDGTTAAQVSFSDDRIDGDALSIAFSDAAFADRNAGDHKTVTVSGITVTGADAGNYTWNVSAQTQASIGKAVLEIVAQAQDKTYDGTTGVTVGLSDNRINADDLSIVFDIANFADRNAGDDKTVTVSGITVTGADAGNYTWDSSVQTQASIGKAVLDIIALAQDKTYDGNTDAQVGLSDNRIEGDALTLAFDAASFDDRNAGDDKTVTVTGIGVTGADADNYTWDSSVQTQASIGKAVLNILAQVQDRTYDGSTDAQASLSDNRIGGDTLTLAFDSASFADRNAGDNKTVTVNGISVTGADAGNYTWDSSVQTQANIGKAVLDILAQAQDRIYDGSTGATVSFTDNRINADDLVIAFDSASFADRNAGDNKTVTVSGITVTGTDVGNYTWDSSVQTQADIGRAVLDILAQAQDRTYDGTTTAQVSLSDNRIAGDTLNITFHDAAFADRHAGDNKTVTVSGIAVTGADAGNYIWDTSAQTQASIGKAVLNIVAQAQDRIYDGTTAAQVSLNDNRIEGDALTIAFDAAFEDRHAGDNKTVTVGGIAVTGADAGNYLWDDSIQTQASIERAVLQITAQAHGREYDGTTQASVTLSDDRFAQDVLQVQFDNAQYQDADAAQGKTVTVSGITVSGVDAGNYVWADQLTTTGDIDRRAITVSADGGLLREHGAPWQWPSDAFVIQGVLVGNDRIDRVQFSSAGVLPDAAPGFYDVSVSDAQGAGLHNYAIHYAEADGALRVFYPPVWSGRLWAEQNTVTRWPAWQPGDLNLHITDDGIRLPADDDIL